MVKNRGWFTKGQPSLNKGRTLESWVGVERAREIKGRMSANSKAKEEFLKSLNANKAYLEKRRQSRHFHDMVVLGIAEELRKRGLRCYVLSEYVKEARTPDAILFDGRRVVAIEVEQEKRYKPSHEAIRERLVGLNSQSGFFDRTEVAFVQGSDLEREVRRSVDVIISKD